MIGAVGLFRGVTLSVGVVLATLALLVSSVPASFAQVAGEPTLTIEAPAEFIKEEEGRITARLENPPTGEGGQDLGLVRFEIIVDVPGECETGDSSQEYFDVTDVNDSGTDQGVDATFTCEEDGNFHGSYGPQTGFPVGPGYDETTTFDVVFQGTAPSGSYSLTGILRDAGDNSEITRDSDTFDVVAQEPSLTIDAPDQFVQEIEDSITARLQNPSTDQGGEDLGMVKFEIIVDVPGECETGDSSQEYFDVTDVNDSGTDQGVDATFTCEEDGNFHGSYGPPTGFPVGQGYDETTKFDVVFQNTGPVGEYALTGILRDAADNSEITRGSAAFDVIAQEGPTLTLTVPEQFVQEVEDTITAELQNPSADEGGQDLGLVTLEIIVDVPGECETGDSSQEYFDVTDVNDSGTDQGVDATFTCQGDGNFHGSYGPPTGFPVGQGYDETTTFDIIFRETGPVGAYELTVNLNDAETNEQLATDTEATDVIAQAPEVISGPCQGYQEGTRTNDAGTTIIVGTQSPDVLVGTGGPDIICGLGGGDEIKGLDGTDIVVGNQGPDTIQGNRKSDQLRGHGGKDTIEGNGAKDQINGGEHADAIDGGDQNDVISGGANADVLRGNGGRDTLRGRSGRDTLQGGRGKDILRSAAGADILRGFTAADTLIAGPGPDILNGGSGTDVCRPGLGNDSVKNCEDR